MLVQLIFLGSAYPSIWTREDGSKPASMADAVLGRPPELVSCFHCTLANIFHVNGERRGEARRGEEMGGREGGERSPNRGYIGKTTWSDGSEQRRKAVAFNFRVYLTYGREKGLS